MTTHITRWSPDTCECVIDFKWDDTAVPRVHTLSNIVKRCQSHSVLVNDIDVYNSVKEENPRKNRVLADILENAPVQLYDETKNGARILKQDYKFNHSFSGTAPNRKLTVSIDGWMFNNQQKNSISDVLTTKYGDMVEITFAS